MSDQDISSVRITPEMLRAFARAEARQTSALASALMNNDSRMFYCPTCDRMVTIFNPIADFLQLPWRDDVFKWNPPVKESA